MQKTLSSRVFRWRRGGDPLTDEGRAPSAAGNAGRARQQPLNRAVLALRVFRDRFRSGHLGAAL